MKNLNYYFSVWRRSSPCLLSMFFVEAFRLILLRSTRHFSFEHPRHCLNKVTQRMHATDYNNSKQQISLIVFRPNWPESSCDSRYSACMDWMPTKFNSLLWNYRINLILINRIICSKWNNCQNLMIKNQIFLESTRDCLALGGTELDWIVPRQSSEWNSHFRSFFCFICF